MQLIKMNRQIKLLLISILFGIVLKKNIKKTVNHFDETLLRLM